MGKIVQPEIGPKFGYLTITSLGSKYGCETTYSCVCKCGKTRNVRLTLLRQGRVTSCGCMNYASNYHGNRKFSPQESSFRAKAANYKSHAKIRNIPFNLSIEEAVELLKGDCFYCGVRPLSSFNIRFNQKYGKTKGHHAYKHATDYEIKYNGIDRVDNEIGYTTKNSVSCCHVCNTAKLDMNTNEFVHWVDRVHDNLRQKSIL